MVTGNLLVVIFILSLALLFFSILKLKIEPFLALVAISILTALAIGMPVKEVASVVTTGFGNTLAGVGILIGLGVIFGQFLGASGAVSAVVFSHILFYPTTGMGLFFIPVYIPSFLFGLLYLGISSWLSKKGGGNINHSAHIWGALAGVVLTIIFCYALSDFDVIKNFVEQVSSIDPGKIIRVGRG